MTRQHIRFSALRSIFWGTLLLFLDFDLNFRFGFSFTLPLLPNCIGFWLVARGTRSLAAAGPGALVPSAVFPRPLPSYPRRALPSGRSGPDVRRLSAVHRSGRSGGGPAPRRAPPPAAAPVPTSCSGCGSSPGPWLPLRRQVDNPLICPGEGFAGGASSSPADCAAPSVMPQGPVPDRHVGAHCAPLHRKNAPLGKEFLLQGRVLFFKTAYR